MANNEKHKVGELFTTERPHYDGKGTAVAYWLMMPNGSPFNIGDIHKADDTEEVHKLVEYAIQLGIEYAKRQIERTLDSRRGQ